jgi:uncharacterized protein with von Willebrand factor type A (vWA) domain
MVSSNSHKNWLPPTLQQFEKDTPGYGKHSKLYNDCYSHQSLGSGWKDAFEGHDPEAHTQMSSAMDHKFSGSDPYEMSKAYGKFIKNFYEPEKKKGSSPGEAMKEALKALEEAKEMMENGNMPGGQGGEDGTPEDLELDREMKEIMKYFARISKLNTIKIGNSHKKIESHRGKINIRQLRGIHELQHVISHQLGMPKVLVRKAIIENQMMIVGRTTKVMLKQDIVVLIDRSGSMSITLKYLRVKALMLTLRPGIVDGSTRLWVGQFDLELKKKRCLTTVEEFDTWFKEFPRGTKGDTDVNKITLEAIEEINSGKWGKNDFPTLEKPLEIIIVNDGQDRVTGVSPVKTHAIIIGEENDGLKNFCEKSGGTYNYIPATYE